MKATRQRRAVDRSTAGSALIALLGIVALALVAATLTSTVTPERGGIGVGAPGGGSGDGPGVLPQPAPQDPPEPITIPFLTELLMAFVAVVTIAMLVYLFLYRREVFRVAVVAAVFLGVLFLLVRLLSAIAPSLPKLGGGGGLLGGSGGVGSGSGASSPPLVALLLLGLVVVGAALAFRTAGDADAEPEDDETSPEAAAVGEAAGRAADRLERDDVGVGNAVYRAWHEMTELLDVADPETTTPGEFAAAAVDAGMDRDDVTELTRLFEDVRYGGYEPTDADERRALAVLRRVEGAYAPEGDADP